MTSQTNDIIPTQFISYYSHACLSKSCNSCKSNDCECKCHFKVIVLPNINHDNLS